MNRFAASRMQRIEQSGIRRMLEKAMAMEQAGKLMEGMEAHLTVPDRDITSMPPDQIVKAKALMTIVDGHVVYDGSL
jgi:predicted amidohydrolase YtcJ